MIGLDPNRKYEYFTDKQADFVASLVNARYAPDAPERVGLREQFLAVRSNADVSALIEQLQAIPVLRVVRTYITELGYYRNPADGTLYRLAERKEGLRVQQYSEVGGLRRLTTGGDLVKGSWKTYGKAASARLRHTIQADWFLTVEQLADYAYSFCGNCGRSLVDGVSVAIGIGPDCARELSIEWSEEAAKAAVARREAAE